MVTQTFPAQQPVGQLVSLQMHSPPEQLWPAWHAAPDPHEQTPPAHPSASWVLQARHVAPWRPHWVRVGEVQTPLAQHPAGQLMLSQPLQPPLEQVCGLGQAWHNAPPLPQRVEL